MYANITPSTYVENTLTSVDKIYSYSNTMSVLLPPLLDGTSSLLTFVTNFPVAVGDTVLLYSTEYPTGRNEVISAVSAAPAPYTCTYTTTSFAVAATSIYLFPQSSTFGEYPIVSVQGASTPAEISPFDIPLTYVSATDIEFVGTSTEDFIFVVGDSLVINDNTTDPALPVTATVVLTSMTKTGVGPYTYTCGYATAIVALDDGLALVDKSSPSSILYAVQDNYPAVENQVLIGYGEVTATDTDNWLNLGRKIVANQGWEILTPFTIDYNVAI